MFAETLEKHLTLVTFHSTPTPTPSTDIQPEDGN
jgi:hypothetical protein